VQSSKKAGSKTLDIDIDFSYWSNCLLRISLDSVLPIYEELGILVSNKKLLQGQIKKRVSENLNPKGYFPNLDFNIKAILLNDIKRMFLETDYHNFYHFVTTIYDTHFEGIWGDWKKWQNALFKFIYAKKYNIENLYTTNSQLSVLSDNIREDYESRVMNKQADLWLTGLYENFKYSLWDKYIFEIAEFDEQSDFNDPFLQLDFTMDMNRFQIFWENSIVSLPESDLNLLYNVCSIINAVEIRNVGQNTYPHSEQQILEIAPFKHSSDNLKPCNQLRRYVRS
jgi:hypothetical protein